MRELERWAGAKKRRGRVGEVATLVLTESTLFALGAVQGWWGLVLMVSAGLVSWGVGRWIETQYHYWHTVPLENLRNEVGRLKSEKAGREGRRAHIRLTIQGFLEESGRFEHERPDTEEAWHDFKGRVDDWFRRVREWLSESLSGSALSAFDSTAGQNTYTYPWAYNKEHQGYVNGITQRRANLEALMNSDAYD